MREKLSTGTCAKRQESVLPGPIFSGPDDCADLVNSLQRSDREGIFRHQAEHFDGSRVWGDRDCAPKISSVEYGRVATKSAIDLKLYPTETFLGQACASDPGHTAKRS
jgi:hypothetical protein